MATTETALALYNKEPSSMTVLNKMPSTLVKIEQMMLVVENHFVSVEENIKETDEKQKKFVDSIKLGQDAANKLRERFQKVTSAVGKMMDAAGKVAELSDQMTNTRTQLSFMVNDKGSVKELEDKIMASAQRSRTSYMDTAAAVVEMNANAGPAFNGNDEVIGFMEQVNKQLALSGSSAEQQQNAMAQISQAMSAGSLRAEQVPALMAGGSGIGSSIESYMGLSAGELQAAAEQGTVTADVIKNAMFYAMEATDKKFADLPMTWEQVWTGMQNKALSVFEPILTKVNEFINSEQFTTVINGIMGGLATVANMAGYVFDFMIMASSGIVSNWSWIAPIIMGIATALAIYKGFLIGYNIVQKISNGLQSISAARTAIKSGASLAEAAATTTATGAQVGLNTALLACPLTWIVLAIIALIVILYAAVAAVNHFQGTSYSATGMIFGAFAMLGANLYNSFIVPLQNAFASIANFLHNVMKDPVAAIKILFLDMASSIIGYLLSFVQGIEALVNMIPGVEIDITSNIEGFKNELDTMATQMKVESEWEEKYKKWEYKDPREAYNEGYNMGKGIEDQVSSMFDSSMFDDLTSKLNLDEKDPNKNPPLQKSPENPAMNETVKNTRDISNSLDYTEEDLSYMRDIAEREAINRFTTAEIRVDMTNNNNIGSDMDLDGVVNYLASGVSRAMERAAEGVHA